MARHRTWGSHPRNSVACTPNMTCNLGNRQIVHCVVEGRSWVLVEQTLGNARLRGLVSYEQHSICVGEDSRNRRRREPPRSSGGSSRVILLRKCSTAKQSPSRCTWAATWLYDNLAGIRPDTGSAVKDAGGKPFITEAPARSPAQGGGLHQKCCAPLIPAAGFNEKYFVRSH